MPRKRWRRAPWRCSPIPSSSDAVGQAACRRVREEFCVERVVPMYEACYRKLLS